MIGYFALKSPGILGHQIEKYLWGEYGLALLVKTLKNNAYGLPLELILFEFFIEGSIPVFMPESLSVRRYSTKEKAISVYVPIWQKDFEGLTSEQRRKLITDKTLEGLGKVRQRLEKKFKDMDFEKLENDYKMVVQNYLDLHKGEI